MSEHTIYVSCAFCMERTEVKVDIPGFTSYTLGADIENGMCEKHSGAKAWLDDQCPGCVSGWGECGLFRAANLDRDMTPLRESERYQIAAGICPRRINGTFGMTVTRDGAEMTDLNISKPSEAGAAMLAAIDDLGALTRDLRAKRGYCGLSGSHEK